MIAVLARLPAHVRHRIQRHSSGHVRLDEHIAAAAAVVDLAVLALPEAHKLSAERVVLALPVVTLVQAVRVALDALPVLAAEPFRVASDLGHGSAADNDDVRLLLKGRVRWIAEQDVGVHHLLGADFALHAAEAGVFASVKVEIQCRISVYAGVAQDGVVHALELCPLDNAVNGLLEDLRGVLRLLVRQKRLNVLVDVV